MFCSAVQSCSIRRNGDQCTEASKLIFCEGRVGDGRVGGESLSQYGGRSTSQSNDRDCDEYHGVYQVDAVLLK